MTLTILGRCPHTGQLGGAVTTSDLAVGARVLFAQAGVAVVATQHRTDPRLGPALLTAVSVKPTAADAVRAVAASTPHRSWRQLGAVDAAGDAAAYSGDRLWPIGAELAGENCLALGNMLSSDRVAPAMVDAFISGPPELAERLLTALEAGLRAGGETGELRSAALLIVEREIFPLVDLRIDDAPEPVRRLRSLWAAYQPLTRQFVTRATDPDHVPDADHAQRSSSTTT
jgi:uncharacterized Ntn-hydrolase superfamily protein